jgi:(p)ppGpp synthase/HD superfamily hydrolase
VAISISTNLPARQTKRCMTSRFGDALRFAEEVHAYQWQAATDVPFVAHVLAVAGLVLDVEGDEDEAIAGLLHAAAQDQGGATQICRIHDVFGDRVATIVEALTESLVAPAHTKMPWMECKRSYLAHLRTVMDRSAYLVLAADTLHTLRVMHAAYGAAGERYWQRFNSGKPGQTWYYEELLELLAGSPADKRRAGLVVASAEMLDRIKNQTAGYMSTPTFA